jgi:hypothetical protein
MKGMETCSRSCDAYLTHTLTENPRRGIFSMPDQFGNENKPGVQDEKWELLSRCV